MSGGKHTIVLVQTTASRATRTFHDYEGIGVAMDGAPLPPPARAPRAAARADSAELARAAGICAMYEQKLKAQNPSHRNITYDISDLFFFVDSLGDLSCLGAPPRSGSCLRAGSSRLRAVRRSVQRPAWGVPAVRQGVDQAARLCAVKTADGWCAVNSRAADIAALCNE